MTKPEISILCPVYNEERFIDACIRSVLNQDMPEQQWELLLIDGMSTDNTRKQIQPYIEQYANIRLIDNPHRTAPFALNIGIREAQGEYICRIDAHTLFPTNYLSRLLYYINHLDNAANVGAVCNTQPANNSRKAQAIAIACSHPLGVGNSTFRVASVKQPLAVDTVPFGFWRKLWFDVVGGFDEQLVRNQDDEFNARTIQHGGRIYLVPDLSVIYYARDSIRKTANMFYQYGLFKPLVNKKLNHPATIRQFVPMLFVLGIVFGIPLAILNGMFCHLFLFFIMVYALLIVFVGVKHRNSFLPLVFPVIHFSYGIGYLNGIYKILFRQSFDVQSNR